MYIYIWVYIQFFLFIWFSATPLVSYDLQTLLRLACLIPWNKWWVYYEVLSSKLVTKKLHWRLLSIQVCPLSLPNVPLPTLISNFGLAYFWTCISAVDPFGALRQKFSGPNACVTQYQICWWWDFSCPIPTFIIHKNLYTQSCQKQRQLFQ